jgi:hypothetical protein
MTPDDRPLRDSLILLRDASLPLSIAVVILMGFLLTLLGLLLFPVNLGVIPFSPDGQLGLLLVILAFQMMAMGETPMGQYKRSWSLTIIGIVFAAMGIISCIVPGILTGVVQMLGGILNIIGGVMLMIKRFLPMLHVMRTPPAEPIILPPLIKNLLTTQTMINIVGITFGIAVLVPSLVSGLVVAGILVINGLLLFILAYFLHRIP